MKQHLDEKIKVGLDLDGVIYDFVTPFKKFLEENDVEIDLSEYSLGLNKEKKHQLTHYLKEFGKKSPFLWLPKYKNAIEMINEMGKIFDYYIITNRSWYEGGEQDTKMILNIDGLNYNRIFFSERKGLISHLLKLNLFIEDNLDNAKDITKCSNANVYLIDKKYNQGVLDKRIKRIKDISEIKNDWCGLL